MGKDHPAEAEGNGYKLPIYFRITDFFVDFFGTLVPGMIFTACLFLIVVGIFIIILSSLNNILPVAKDIKVYAYEIYYYVKPLISIFYLIFIILFIVSAYIFGHIFFRLGPKQPDQKSFLRIFESVYDDDWVHQVHLIEYKNENISDKKKLSKFKKLGPHERWLIAQKEENIKKLQWPYLHLGKYLEKRLNWLIELVPWHREESEVKRSKTFMNALKGSIQFHFPWKYSTIARNEAHVRLMSSSWFMCHALIKLSFISIIIAISFPLLGLSDKIMQWPEKGILYLCVLLIILEIIILIVQYDFIYDKIK